MSVLLLALTTACGDTNTPDDSLTQDSASGGDPIPFDGLTPLSSEESAWFAEVLPAARYMGVDPIPEELLTADDIEYENTELWRLYDADGVLLGYSRKVFSPVYCSSGSCEAIRFILLYGSDRSFSQVFHPAGTNRDFMKYWEDSYSPFTDADRAQLNDILRNPPAVLTAVTDADTLVTDASSTAPTRVEYQGVVVRGAAFTTYCVLMFRLDTDEILAAVNGGP